MNPAATSLPDSTGHFGQYGGVFVPETLIAALQQLEREYAAAKSDPKFHEELQYYLRQFVGRPNPLYFAKRLTDHFGGAQIYLKREDFPVIHRPLRGYGALGNDASRRPSFPGSAPRKSGPCRA